MLTLTAPLSAFAARKAIANVASPEIASSRTCPENLDIPRDGNCDGRHEELDQRPRKRRWAPEIAKPLHRNAESEHREIISKKRNRSNESRDATVSLESVIPLPEFWSTSDLEQESAESEVRASTPDIVHQLCNFNPSPKNVIGDTEDDWTVRLAGEDIIMLIGQYDLWVRKGVVSFYGATLPASSALHRVYAPSTHALPVLKSITNPYGRYGEPAEVTISSTKSGLRLLRDLSPEFGRIWNEFVDGAGSRANMKRRSFALIRTSADDNCRRLLSRLNLAHDWQECIWEILAQTHSNGHPVILVCGPKGSGKSTYCRILTNAILSRSRDQSNRNMVEISPENSVALLDIDPGQPEFSLPGQLSLVLLEAFNFGPPFTHPTIETETGNRKIRRLSFGNLSPRDDPPHYVSCVLNLFETFRNLSKSHRGLPLVINSSGWVQGGGLELLVQLIQRLPISNLVYLNNSSTGLEDIPQTLANICSNQSSTFHPLTGSSQHPSTRTAAELRTMQTLSYFHLTQPEAGNLRWNPRPLQEAPPLVLYYAGPKQAILTVMILGDAHDPGIYETILTGSLVDIVLIENNAALPTTTSANDTTIDGTIPHDHHQPTRIFRTPSSLIPYLSPQSPQTRTIRPLNPTHTQTLAQALIRSIDTRTKQFHLLVPLHLILPKLQQLENSGLSCRERIVLVRGKGDVPDWAFGEALEVERARWRRRQVAAVGGDAEDKEDVLIGEEDLRDVPWASLAGEAKRGGRAGRKRSGGRSRSQVGGEGV